MLRTFGLVLDAANFYRFFTQFWSRGGSTGTVAPSRSFAVV